MPGFAPAKTVLRKISRGILAAVFFRAPKKAKNVAEALERLRRRRRFLVLVLQNQGKRCEILLLSGLVLA